MPFGRSLTAVATLPASAERSMEDPFAEKTRPWGVYALIALIVAGAAAWKLGYAATWWADLKTASAPPLGAPAASAAPVAPVAPVAPGK